MSRPDPQRDILQYDTGHYRLSRQVSLIATQAAAPAALASLRWTDATRLMVIERIKLKIIQAVALTATQAFDITGFVARSYTVTDTGGTSVISSVVKTRTNMSGSLLGDLRVATSAAGVVAGTRTLDASGFVDLEWVGTITNINTVLYEASWDAGLDKHPLVLAQNEGFVISQSAAMPAAGQASMFVELDWAEVDGFGP